MRKRKEKQDCLSIDGGPPTNYIRTSRFCSCDLDLDPMTLIYELDLDIMNPYMRTKNEFSR